MVNAGRAGRDLAGGGAPGLTLAGRRSRGQLC